MTGARALVPGLALALCASCGGDSMTGSNPETRSWNSSFSIVGGMSCGFTSNRNAGPSP